MTTEQLIFTVIWFLMGLISCLIFNKILLYETKVVKIFWNLIAFISGGLSLFLSLLNLIVFIIKNKKKIIMK